LSERGDDIHEDTGFPSKDLRNAFQKLAPTLGRSSVESMILDFLISGLSLDNDDTVHKLSEFRSVMGQMLGPEAANLIMQRVKNCLIKYDPAAACRSTVW
jgi:hypothetical protein